MIYLFELLLPFVGTTAGAAMIFVFKDRLGQKTQKAFLGFASGIMIAASVWSLLIPSISFSEIMAEGKQHPNLIKWIAPTFGFLIGIFFLLFLDIATPHLHALATKPEGPSTATKKLSRSTLLFLAILLHNIPEGLAVGISISGYLNLAHLEVITLGHTLALSIAIALQNFPEGAIVSIPMQQSGMSKMKAFLLGVLSGAVEPLAALFVLFIPIKNSLPWSLSFAAGAMIYVVTEELIPQAHEGQHSNIPTISLAIGFTTMMLLEIVL